jgi:APA family basic amino acid/polyamine antiporter
MSVSKHGLSRELNRKDTLALAVGAMIGWGWMIVTAGWLNRGGTLGAVLGLSIVGVVATIIAFIYAELASAMPEVGGEHVYSLRALGFSGSFVCSWAILLVYISVGGFEAVALSSVTAEFIPGFQRIFLWEVAGYEVYLSWALVGVLGAVVITVINILGIKLSAVFQTTVTAFVIGAGIFLILGALGWGSSGNIEPLFASGAAGVMGVAAMAPFLFTGFDVIPQAAEEIDLPPRTLGLLIPLAVVLALTFYLLIIVAVSLILPQQSLLSSDLATADAAAAVWGRVGKQVLLLAGVAGIVTSWNAFLVGGSRILFALGESGMLPRSLGILHPRYRTPYRAIIAFGIFSAVAPFFGRQMLIWIVDAASFSVVIAYFFVALSFIQLRRNEPDLPRPFRLRGGLAMGWIGVACTVALAAIYMPWSPSALIWPYEWGMVMLWSLLGVVLYMRAERPLEARSLS